ncbi:hypothetical protein ABZ462_26700 [Streptomyces albogriseolus]
MSWHLSTGFLGTPRLLPVLTDTGHTDTGHTDTAYRLLTRRTFPSWGYQIDHGATTMWERWDSLWPDGAFQDPGMNSFTARRRCGSAGTPCGPTAPSRTPV